MWLMCHQCVSQGLMTRQTINWLIIAVNGYLAIYHCVLAVCYQHNVIVMVLKPVF